MINRIKQLKKQKNAVILAHYYAPSEAQEIADFVGDSFYLAKVASQTDADIIVFCGVAFMGESAKLLNPKKKVLMPDLSADCPMAHMVADGAVQRVKEMYDDVAVVCYINSTAALKCISDVCVTSSNAVKIVKSLPQKNIFFIPDKNLGRFVAEQVPEKNIILNDGCCPIHAELTACQLDSVRRLYSEALVLAHPECNEEVVSSADFVGSTADIINYVSVSDAKCFIICTESGVEHKLVSDNPGKKFIFPDTLPKCVDMKLNTLENILYVLENETNNIEMDETIAERALVPLKKMLECAK